MAANVQIMRWNGSGSGTPTDITNKNTRANAEDINSDVSTTNPVQIPAGGATNYSFWVCTRLFAQSPPSGGISNLRWYSTGTNNLGSFIGCIGAEARDYVMAQGTVGTTGIQLTTASYVSGALGQLGNVVDVFSLNSNNVRSFSGNLPAGGTGHFGYWFVYQITVQAQANPGLTGQTTFTFKYDET